MKIKKITKTVSNPDLPDGAYEGVWHGYQVTFFDIFGEEYDIHVDKGCRGFQPCSISIENKTITNIEAYKWKEEIS